MTTGTEHGSSSNDIPSLSRMCLDVCVAEFSQSFSAVEWVCGSETTQAVCNVRQREQVRRNSPEQIHLALFKQAVTRGVLCDDGLAAFGPSELLLAGFAYSFLRRMNRLQCLPAPLCERAAVTHHELQPCGWAAARRCFGYLARRSPPPPPSLSSPSPRPITTIIHQVLRRDEMWR